MAYNIIKYSRYNDDRYVYIQRIPGIYSQKLSLYFAYMHSIFDFKFRYGIVKDVDLPAHASFRLLEEGFNPKDRDILNILKSRNYEV